MIDAMTNPIEKMLSEWMIGTMKSSIDKLLNEYQQKLADYDVLIAIEVERNRDRREAGESHASRSYVRAEIQALRVARQVVVQAKCDIESLLDVDELQVD